MALAAPDGSFCPGVTVMGNGPAGNWDEKAQVAKYKEHLNHFEVILDHTWQKWSYVLRAEGLIKCPILSWCHAPVETMMKSLPPVEKPCFVCISEDQRRFFEATFGKPCRCCYNGVDPDWYKPLGLSRKNRYLFLGRFSTIKGPDLCITACQQTDAELDLIGDLSITGEPEFSQQCQRACDGTKRRFHGSCSRAETVYWYSQAKALLHLNQRFREPFGLAVVEAQACGLPVIGWRYGSLPEVVKEGETGFLVDSLEEVVNLIKADAVSSIDREACRKWATRFSTAAMVQRVEELCTEALKTGGW